MKTSTPSAQAAILAVVAIASAPSATAQGTAFATLLEFVGSDGSLPASNLVSDSAGNLYGVASGADRLAHSAGLADPTATTAARFQTFQDIRRSMDNHHTGINFTGGSDGGNPMGGLIFDKAGNLYGTTDFGGLGAGVGFELSPTAYG